MYACMCVYCAFMCCSDHTHRSELERYTGMRNWYVHTSNNSTNIHITHHIFTYTHYTYTNTQTTSPCITPPPSLTPSHVHLQLLLLSSRHAHSIRSFRRILVCVRVCLYIKFSSLRESSHFQRYILVYRFMYISWDVHNRRIYVYVDIFMYAFILLDILTRIYVQNHISSGA